MILRPPNWKFSVTFVVFADILSIKVMNRIARADLQRKSVLLPAMHTKLSAWLHGDSKVQDFHYSWMISLRTTERHGSGSWNLDLPQGLFPGLPGYTGCFYQLFIFSFNAVGPFSLVWLDSLLENRWHVNAILVHDENCSFLFIFSILFYFVFCTLQHGWISSGFGFDSRSLIGCLEMTL